MKNGIAHRKSGIANRKALRFPICDLRFAILLLSFCSPAHAKTPTDIRNELPPPFGLQAVVLKKTITLSWQWQPPEELPVFTEFGYELKRQDGKTFSASGVTYADRDLFPGTYRYAVRARGVSKEKGKRITYVSDWTTEAEGVIKMACPRPPSIDLTVEPAQKKYTSMQNLRFHLKGQASVDGGCSLGAVTYRLDAGAGIVHSALLPVDNQGHFDSFVNAFGPEDEIPSGHVSVSITATAENEAGPTTSNAYTVDLDVENPFAPHQP